MVNKAKKQGTNYETNIVNRLNDNVNLRSQRFAEGGSNDLGDIQLFAKDEEYFIEAKSRQNLNLHQSLDKAIEKSGYIIFKKKINKQFITINLFLNYSRKEFTCRKKYYFQKNYQKNFYYLNFY